MQFYSCLASNLVAKLPIPSKRFDIESVKVFYSNKLDLSEGLFSFRPIQEETVLKILQSLDIEKSAGIDNISGKFLKDGAEFLSRPLTEICNLSIKLKQFPNNCKITKVKPLSKKGAKTDCKIFRPISLLPLLYKILEKVVHDQTTEYLDKSDLLYKFQSGFRKNHSIDTALSFLTNKISNGFDSGMLTGMVLIDLQKAFDTIDYEILLKKIPFLGFAATTVEWFTSYLSKRTFRINVKNAYSQLADLNCGVPQGSILGPLLFLLNVNDMIQAVDCDLFLYADDSCLVFQDKDIKNVENQLNRNFSNL